VNGEPISDWKRFIRECNLNESADVVCAAFPHEFRDPAQIVCADAISVCPRETAEISGIVFSFFSITMR
jgi:hypothetical protein